MSAQKYSLKQEPIQTIISWIRSGDLAIPEIQRPFVWSAIKVRDLINSLYSGFPVGYLIIWRNPTVKLKDGTSSEGKRILIDGQQRVMALMTSLLGKRVVNKYYKREQLVIAFHPPKKKFEVSNAAIRKDKTWIPDISKVFSLEIKISRLVRHYCENNPDTDRDEIYESIELLRGIINNQIGLIELNSDLDIETVTEIFIRINSKGVVLSQADFAMSKIASNEFFRGNEMRKCIDYFCHLAVDPKFYQKVADQDQEFSETAYFQKMSWLKNKHDDLYGPSYTDMLRVAFTSEFKKGRLGVLVALLTGRNFETRTYEEAIAEDSFSKLERGLFNFMNETNFNRFLMILRSAGFIEASMARSQNAINFAYIVYLVLKSQRIKPSRIESYVRKWFVMSILTSRYSGSPESVFDTDIRRIDGQDFAEYLHDVESAELSDAFWDAGLPQKMHTSVAISPYFKVYLAAQVYTDDKGFLSRDISVRDLITHGGNVHHLFPKNYLKKRGLTKSMYNQIANYVMMQSDLNIAIRDKAPSAYFTELLSQASSGKDAYGTITNEDQLRNNFTMHCIPDGMNDKTIEHYNGFLRERRKLMAQKIKKYYQNL